MKTVRIVYLAALTLLALAEPVLAQTEYKSGLGTGAGIGAGLAIVGAGIGLGLIGYSALAAMARQPEMAGRTQITMLLVAALLEGVVLFALVICYLIFNKI